MIAHLTIDGTYRAARKSVNGWLRFPLNLPAREIRLVSGFGRPTDFGDTNDTRLLGVALRGLRWRQGDATIEVPLDSPGFIDGFHHLEIDEKDATPFRWTTGNAALPPDLFPPWRGEALVDLSLREWRGSTAEAPANAAASVLNEFESLGDNCELALAQRDYGVELPLGLLRWSGTSHEMLLRGLENRFLGLGDPATTEVRWRESDYRLQTPYMNMHTTAIEPRDSAGVAEILRCGCATLRLLRRKLLRDIADARRIFVFRSADPMFGQAEMRRLHAALRDIGPVALLCVTLGGPRRSGREVRRLDDGLYAAYLDNFVVPHGPFDTWLDLCTRTLKLHRGNCIGQVE